MTEARAARSRTVVSPFAASASTFHNAAVWSLRALLAVVIFAWFGIAQPRAAQLTLSLELGRRAVLEHRFEIGWLGSLLTYLTHMAAGFGGLAALGGVLVVATLALVEFRARPRTGDVLSLAATILAAFCLLDVLRVGGSAAHWICAAAFLLAFERGRRFGLVLAALIAAVWANVSPDAILAPFIAALVATGRLIDRRACGADAIWLVASVAGCAAALALTPAGMAYFSNAPLAAHLDRALAAVIPFGPNLVAPRAYAALFGLLLVGAALGLQRCRWEDRLPFVAALVLGFWNAEFLPLVGIVAAPILVGTIVRGAPAFFAPATSRSRLTNGLIAAIAIVLAVGYAASVGARVASNRVTAEPAQLVIERAVADGKEHRLFCVVVEWCNYAVSFGNVRTLMDGRIERSDSRVREAQRAIARVTPGWRGELAKRRIDAVVVHRSDALSQLLAYAPGWEAIDLRDGVVMFERSGSGTR